MFKPYIYDNLWIELIEIFNERLQIPAFLTNKFCRRAMEWPFQVEHQLERASDEGVFTEARE